ncbi:MAG: glycoside hydrolase family 24 [Desulfurellales bacterium]|nr:MAG: glycoside hydrolase family 24 [Desulfurellales bacterium]
MTSQSSSNWQRKLLLTGAPAALIAAVSSPFAYNMLERWEGNILYVYKDIIGVPTYCAGQTANAPPVGAKLTSDFCKEINKTILMEYSYAILQCTKWDQLTPARIVALTLFAVNVGKAGACGSQAVLHINIGQVAKGCALIANTPSGAPNWSTAGGKFVQGLYNRRQSEAKLCLQDSLPI